mgnify:CR=1 FL=1
MAATEVRARARAKVNLTLHVTGQRSNGYHELDSLVVFADVHDEVQVKPGDDLKLVVEGPEAMGLAGEGDNLVLRAARCFNSPDGAALRLTKCLPVASGIGGGSADAAAALVAVAVLARAVALAPAALGQVGPHPRTRCRRTCASVRFQASASLYRKSLSKEGLPVKNNCFT